MSLLLFRFGFLRGQNRDIEYIVLVNPSAQVHTPTFTTFPGDLDCQLEC
jgi:hypothetical protein